MAKPMYGVGDLVMLESARSTSTRSDGEFRILAILPESNGQVQYHVRSAKEGFDRRILSSEIDVEKSARPRSVADGSPARRDRSKPWLTPLSVNTRK